MEGHFLRIDRQAPSHSEAQAKNSDTYRFIPVHAILDFLVKHLYLLCSTYSLLGQGKRGAHPTEKR